MKVKLYAPETYWKLTADAVLEISNGCGGKGVGALVPNKFITLNVRPACDIHDYMYHVGEGDKGKLDADEVFLYNLVRICDERYIESKRRWLYKIRLWMCRKYYNVVKDFGGKWYWANKNKDSEMGVYDIN